MNTLTDKEKIELHAQLEVYKRVLVKAEDVKANRINAAYLHQEISREIKLIEEKLKEPPKKQEKPEKVDVITPEHSPGDTIRHRLGDVPMMFTVMEVRHSTQEYKLTSQNQIKPITVLVGWGEIDEK